MLFINKPLLIICYALTAAILFAECFIDDFVVYGVSLIFIVVFLSVQLLINRLNNHVRYLNAAISVVKNIVPIIYIFFMWLPNLLYAGFRPIFQDIAVVVLSVLFIVTLIYEEITIAKKERSA